VETAVKLILTITTNDDANRLIDALIEHEFRATRINSAGGFLKKGNSTVVIGVAEEYVNDVIDLIRKAVTHANVFVLDVARFEKL
jgi:uncharacterized protein YaaQ